MPKNASIKFKYILKHVNIRILNFRWYFKPSQVCFYVTSQEFSFEYIYREKSGNVHKNGC